MPRVQPAQSRSPQRPPATEPPEVVDPRWILKAIAAVFALGLLCAYITLCAFFYTGQWQFVLHPSHEAVGSPASQGLTFQQVGFGKDVSGRHELTGWWIPGDTAADPVVLMLGSGTGSMSNSLGVARALHDARLNVLLFDYEGFGRSGGLHPTQRSMEQDASRALQYLTTVRQIPQVRVLVFGMGLGASLATTLCTQQKALPAIMLLDADGDTTSRVLADQRSKVVPVSLLFHERFPLADPLHTLRTPKLLISFTKGLAPEIAQRAADPKMTVELDPASGPQAITPAVRRFLDTYVSHPPQILRPSP